MLDGGARAGVSLCNELRNWVFATVAQKGVRRLSAQTFEHLHRLDLAFHLNRQTGGLSRALDRGGRGITFLLNAIVFNVVPLMLEISLVCGVLVKKKPPSFHVVGTILLLIFFCLFSLVNKSPTTMVPRTLVSLLRRLRRNQHQIVYYWCYLQNYVCIVMRRLRLR
jgi:ABC-type transport system involved in Fe-S cluster assembly fused permease/ATPase subunit